MIKQSFLMKGFMVRVHHLQKSLHMRLFLGDGEVIKTEVVFVRLRLLNYLRSSSKQGFIPSLKLHNISKQLSW